MSIVQALLNRVFWWRDPPNADQGTEGLQSILQQWEIFLQQIQNVIVWQQPTMTLTWLVVFNILFWAVVCLEWRFYGLLFTGVTLAAVLDCARHFGLLESSRDSMASFVFPSSASPQTFKVLSSNELHEYITALIGKSASSYQRLKQLRAEQPGTFCATLCGFFLVMSMIGKSISGPTMIYLLFMSVFTLPGLLVRFPSFLQYLPNLNVASGADVDDYLPQTSGETIKLLSLHESVDESSSSNVIGDASLYPDLTTMPSYEHSMDYLLDPDADIPSPRQVDRDSEESDISEAQELNFKTKHFKGSSSSSSGDDLSKGLRFKANKARRQSSSDSNESFEFVTKDDL